jgi:hypothetical protein
MSVHPIPGTGTPAQPAPHPETPTSLLGLVAQAITDDGQTANLTKIVTTSGKEISRIVLSVGLVLIATLALAVIMIYFAGLGPAIGGGIAATGTGTAWLGRTLWTRHKAKKAAKQIPGPRRRNTGTSPGPTGSGQ